MRTARIALFVFVATTLAAQTPHFVGPKPDPSRIAVQKDVVFGSRGLKFDLYRPAGDAIVPVVIFGNIGNAGMKNWPGYVGWGEAVAGEGMAAVHYDATQENAVADFDALLVTLRERAARDHIDLSRIVIWSGSSNVMVGLPLAMDARRTYIRAAVVYYGDAPVTEIRLDLPLLFARAGRDVPQLNQRIDALAQRALTANAPWTVINVPAGTHGFDAFDSDEVARSVVVRTLEFMKSVTMPAISQAYVDAAVEAANAAAFARSDWDAAIAGYRKRIAGYPSDGEGHRRLGLALSAKQQYAEALPMFERAYELGRGGVRDTQIPAAVAAAGAGNVARAVYWLDKALATRFGGEAAAYRTDPRFATIANDPAFIAVIAKYTR